MTDTFPILFFERPAPFEPGMTFQARTFDSLSETTDWLDHLENHGVEAPELSVVDGRFRVTWR